MLAMMLVLWYNFALEISNFSLSFGELLSRKFRIFMNFLLVNIDDFHRVYFSFNVRNDGCCDCALVRAIKSANLGYRNRFADWDILAEILTST